MIGIPYRISTTFQWLWVDFWSLRASKIAMDFRPHPPIDSGSPSERLVHAVAEQTNTDPLELPPLYESIDPEAIDALFTTLEDGYIEFQYAGQVVRYDGDGAVHLTDDVVPDARRTD